MTAGTRWAVIAAIAIAGVVAVRWLRAGAAMNAADWATADPIGPDDLAG
ncbi:hypothetical protein ACFWQG_10985 [Rhodococcus sp. NPDC058532]